MGLAPAFASADPEFNAGIHVADATQAQRRLDEGWKMIAVASEVGFMLGNAGESAQALGLGGHDALAKY